VASAADPMEEPAVTASSPSNNPPIRHTGARSLRRDSGIHLDLQMDPAVSKTRTGETEKRVTNEGNQPHRLCDRGEAVRLTGR
jgi:hypothetical protein